MPTIETGKNLTESEVSGLEYQETELTLGMPGKSRPSELPERKRGFSETIVELNLGSVSGVNSKDGADRASGSDSSDGPSADDGKPPAAKAQVVGWPPVRSFRRNALKSCSYVKVAVDGAPYLRKVDLESYGGYQELLAALPDMFSCFTGRNKERRVTDPANGTEYVPTYEDKDGDWMLVGDVPWKMFVASCKRIRLMKSSEAVNLGIEKT